MTGAARTTIGKLTQGGPKKRGPIRIGRQTKLTPEVSKKICDAVRAGNYITVAARYAGVSEFTVNEWVARGRGTHSRLGPSSLYTRFTQDLDEAEAASEVAAVLHWRSAMPKDWHSSEKWLRVRAAERWSDAPEGPRSIAAVQLNIGSQGGSASQIGANDPNSLPNVPLERLLDSNPTLIESTMQILDQFLPIDQDSGEMLRISPEVGTQGGPSARNGAHFSELDPIEGEFTQLEDI